MNYNDNQQSATSQNALIGDWLLGGGKLTALDALQQFGCMRLASRICDLRKRGMNITAERVITPSGKCVTQYSIAQ